MQQSRRGGSVGGCVWLVVCVLMMSAWDDGDAGTFDLATDHEVAAPGGGVVASLSRSVVDDCAAEESDGAVFGSGAAPSDNNNNKVVVGSVVGDRGMTGTFDLASDFVAAGGAASGLARRGEDAEEIGWAVFGFEADIDHTWSVVDDSAGRACGIGDSEYWGPCDMPTWGCDAEDHEVAAPGGGVVASLSRSVVDDCAAEEVDGAVFGFGVAVILPGVGAGATKEKTTYGQEADCGVSKAHTRKGDDAEETGGAVFGFGAAVGRTWRADGDSVEEPRGRDHVAVVMRLQSRCDAEESGGAEGHSCNCDAEALLPGVDVSATKGMLWGDELCDESGNAWVTWNWVPKIIMCDSLPEGCSRFFDAIIQQITTAGDVLQSYVVRRHVDPGVGIGATKGLSGCRWKVQVRWMLEEKLAKMQIDAVITDVTSEESANSGCEEENVLVESHLVVGIYFGRR